jgi:hypothetical protein
VTAQIRRFIAICRNGGKPFGQIVLGNSNYFNLRGFLFSRIRKQQPHITLPTFVGHSEKIFNPTNISEKK